MNDIEALLEIGGPTSHPLDILGYGYTTEGALRFRAERPDFFPQLVAHIQGVLEKEGVFPKNVDVTDPGFETYIQRTEDSYKISYVNEVGFSRFERVQLAKEEADAIRELIKRRANPDYIAVI